MPIVDALHREWPELSFDVTIKVEHLLRHRALLPDLRRTGCAFITTAVESFDDAVLAKLAKGHTHADFLEALRLTRAADLPFSPTFIPFTPWTTLESYTAFLRELAELDLIEQVAPVQLAALDSARLAAFGTAGNPDSRRAIRFLISPSPGIVESSQPRNS